MLDYYRILGIPPDATPSEVKKSYLEAARRWHPDKNMNNEIYAVQKFKEVSQAYKILSDSAQRRKYDQDFRSWSSWHPWGQKRSYPSYTQPPSSNSSSQPSSSKPDEGNFYSQFSFANLFERGGNILKEGHRLYKQFLSKHDNMSSNEKTKSEYSFAKSKTAYCFTSGDGLKNRKSSFRTHQTGTNQGGDWSFRKSSEKMKPNSFPYDDFGTHLDPEDFQSFIFNTAPKSLGETRMKEEPCRRWSGVKDEELGGKESEIPIEICTTTKIINGNVQLTKTRVYEDRSVSQVYENGVLIQTLIHHTHSFTV